MKVLYFDCFSGVSGDMVLGALLDMGLDLAEFKRRMSLIGLDHEFELIIEKTEKKGITGTDVEVVINEQEHHDDHHDQHHHHGRNMRDIENLIKSSKLSDKVKETSLKIFYEVAKAEAKVHGKSIEEVHFHEVGAVDSIVDTVGSAICIDMLGVDKVISSSVVDGKGFIKCRHGLLPVPVPAVLEMLTDSGIPYTQTDVETELVTPTGLAIIKTFSAEYGAMPLSKILKNGYGFGKRETGRLNSLRAVLCEVEEFQDQNEISVLETNIDDTTGEALGFAAERLFEAGALDVFYTPIYMKKGRPAVLLSVICESRDEDRLAVCILENTSSIGLRKYRCERYVMDRHFATVQTGFGPVRVKICSYKGIEKASPEYEDCAKIARANQVPLDNVYRMVMDEYGKQSFVL